MPFEINLSVDAAEKETGKLITAVNKLTKALNTEVKAKSATDYVKKLADEVRRADSAVKNLKATVRAAIKIKVDSRDLLTAQNRAKSLAFIAKDLKGQGDSVKFVVDASSAKLATVQINSLNRAVARTIELSKKPMTINTGSTSELRQINTSLTDLSLKLKQLAEGYNKSATAAAKHTTALQKDATAAKKVATQHKTTSKSTKELEGSLIDSSQAAAMFRASMLASGHSMGLFTAHTIVAAATVFGFIKVIRSTVGAGAELENSMQRVFAISGILGPRIGDVTGQMEMMSKAVRDVAKGTIFTATEVSKGAVEFAMAGFKAEETASALSATASLAAIGMTDMAVAARTVANILRAFGLAATETQEVVDRMSVAVTNSMMDIRQLGQALSYVGPLAAETNTSFKDTVIILELMHDAGIKSSKAGTALRRGMINLLNPTKKQLTVLDELKISLKDGSGEMRSMLAISKQLKARGIDPMQKSILFGARAVAAWSQVIEQTGKRMKDFEKDQEDVAGASLLLRKQLEQNLVDQFKILLSAIEEVQHVLFEQFGPGLVSLVKDIAQWVRGLEDSKVEVLAVVKSMGVFIAATMTIVGATLLANTALGQSVIVLIDQAFKLGASAVAQNIYAVATVKATAATSALTAATGFWAKSMVVAKAVLLTISAHPLIAAATAAAAAFIYLTNTTNEAAEAQRSLKTSAAEATKELQKQVNIAFVGREQKLKAKIDITKKLLAELETPLSAQTSGAQQGAVRQITMKGAAHDRFMASLNKEFELTTKLNKLALTGEQSEQANRLTRELGTLTKAWRVLAVDKEKALGTYATSEFAKEDAKAKAIKLQLDFEKRRQELLKERVAVSAKDEPEQALKVFKDQISLQKISNAESLKAIQYQETLGKISPYESLSAQMTRTVSTQKILNVEYEKQKSALEGIRDAANETFMTGKASETFGQTELDRLQRQFLAAEENLRKLEVAHKKETNALKVTGAELERNIRLAEKYVITQQGSVKLQKPEATPAESLEFVTGLRQEEAGGTAVGAEKASTKQLEQLNEAYMQTVQLQGEHHERFLMSEQEFEDRRLQIQIASAASQAELWGGHHTGIFNFAESVRADDLAGMLSNGSAMLDGAAQQSKKAFEAQKAVNIAQAVMSTYTGMSKALEWGWPMGPIFAALIAANGFASVNAIRATSFNGGGTVASPSTAAPIIPAAPLDSTALDDTSRGVTINIDGNLYANDDFRRAMVEALELAESNDEIRILNGG